MLDAGTFLDASEGLRLLLALGAGLISFLTPCVLPIVPPYLAFMAGSSLERMTTEAAPDRGRVVTAAAFFVLGLSVVFVLMGAAASWLGQAVLQNQDWLLWLAGTVVILFGLHFLGLFRIPLLYREARIDAGRLAGGPLGAFVLGLAFAFGWTPCIGPILGTILGFASQGEAPEAMLFLGLYAMGLGLPFLAAALFMRRFIAFLGRFRAHLGKVEKAMGAMLLAVGLLMVTGGFTSLSFWLLETFPILAQIG
ncbi:MAG TPA: cytochrome c biogenesis protein CcdA [Paracoccaceae bacterium]|nr:cytochrome c biogenesis protein CcdA [Paracoccaceae bacterium]